MKSEACARARLSAVESSGVEGKRSAAGDTFACLPRGARFRTGSSVVRKRFERDTARFSLVAAEIFELRISRQPIVHGREKVAIEREHQRVPRAGDGNVEQSLHFLPAQKIVRLFDFFFPIFLVQGGDDFVACLGRE